jgi:hypothetical protein
LDCYFPKTKMRPSRDQKPAFTVANLGACVTFVSLVIAIALLWQRVHSLNQVIVDMDERLLKVTSNSGKSNSNAILQPLQQQQPSSFERKPEMRSMKEIGSHTGTDKVLSHGYERFYEYFLSPLREVQGLKMLEIGFNLGYSYKMWLEYFPHGKVYFMEKDHGAKYADARFTGDQGKIADLSRLLDTKDLRGQLDFIIDDGSHHPEHQMTSFTYLFENGLKPGGIYIIEDTETSYWRSGDTYGLPTLYGKDSPNSAINRLKGLIDVVNRRYQPANEPFQSTFGKTIDDNVQSIFFGPNSVNNIKMLEGELKKYDADYPWKAKLEKPKAAQ